MNSLTILLMIIIPAVISLLILLISKKDRFIKDILAFIAVSANFIISILLFKDVILLNFNWIKIGNFQLNLSFRLYHFSAFILASVAFFALLTVIYSISFMRNKNNLKIFYSFMLLTLGFVNGAVLSNNLILMLFFWEALLIFMFVLILTGGQKSIKTAIKGFVLVGIGDLCMILGIAIAGYKAKTFMMDGISLNIDFLTGFAFILLLIGALSKAGAMPFHSWIPDAAIDAPLPFMAFLPASLEKLLGIYFLTRVSMDFFKVLPDSSLSYIIMTTGAATIILAVMMALIQKDYKRLLSYHAISQVGYMILGIGTALPIGIIGGLFHMINHTIYKSCLFLTGGAVEKQTGTTDLEKLGGLGKFMPVTFTCFIISALSISGVPPFNGFFSKELIYDAALESGLIFYLIAALGSFFTAASFLKLGHAVYMGKNENNYKIKEAPVPMLFSIIILAVLCISFGIFNYLPLRNLIQPILGENIKGHDYSGMPENIILVMATIFVTVFALINHLASYLQTKKGVKALDHIHHAPILNKIYDWAEKKYFDPYDILINMINFISKILWYIDRAIDWFYNVFLTKLVKGLSFAVRKVHTGSHSMYILWTIIGLALIVIYFIRI